MRDLIHYRFQLRPIQGASSRPLKHVAARIRHWYRERLFELPRDNFTAILEAAAGGLGQPTVGRSVRGEDGACFVQFDIKAGGDIRGLGRLTAHFVSQLHARDHKAMTSLFHNHGYELLSKSQRDSSRWTTTTPEEPAIRLIGHSDQNETRIDVATGSFSAPVRGRMVETTMHSPEHPEFAFFTTSTSSIPGEPGEALSGSRSGFERSRFFSNLDESNREMLAEFYRSGRCDCPICRAEDVRPRCRDHLAVATTLRTEPSIGRASRPRPFEFSGNGFRLAGGSFIYCPNQPTLRSVGFVGANRNLLCRHSGTLSRSYSSETVPDVDARASKRTRHHQRPCSCVTAAEPCSYPGIFANRFQLVEPAQQAEIA